VILPHALVEKEAYRVMFALARPPRALTAAHVSGLETAIAHAESMTARSPASAGGTRAACTCSPPAPALKL
jgi:hypothetical protein